jgi:hypothetical protein
MDITIVGEVLMAQLRQIVPGATFPVAAAQALGELYNDRPLPQNQSRAELNALIRQLGVLDKPNKPLRAELVILLILLYTMGLPPQVRDQHDLCTIYGFSANEVEADESLALFESYMDIALLLVNPYKHMDFIIVDVVVPLSEAAIDALSRRRYVSGGGSETVETCNRYYIFEFRTGFYRTKTVALERHLRAGAAPNRGDPATPTSVESQQHTGGADTNPAVALPFWPVVPLTMSNHSYLYLQASLATEEANQPVSDTMLESAQASSALHARVPSDVIDFMAQGFVSPHRDDSESGNSDGAPDVAFPGHTGA